MLSNLTANQNRRYKVMTKPADTFDVDALLELMKSSPEMLEALKASLAAGSEAAKQRVQRPKIVKDDYLFVHKIVCRFCHSEVDSTKVARWSVEKQSHQLSCIHTDEDVSTLKVEERSDYVRKCPQCKDFLTEWPVDKLVQLIYQNIEVLDIKFKAQQPTNGGK